MQNRHMGRDGVRQDSREGQSVRRARHFVHRNIKDLCFGVDKVSESGWRGSG